MLIFLAAGWIIYEAVKKLIRPGAAMEEASWGVAVMLVSAVANMLVSHQLFKVGKETDSVALQADAWHLRTDVYTSAGVMVGLAIIWVGKLIWHVDLHWVDPVTAIVVALLILQAAWHLTKQSARDLLDVSLPAEEEAWVRDYIVRLHPTVCGFHHLRTRKSGSIRFIEFHLIVEADMSVEDAHRISEVISCDIEEHFPGSSVTVHIEPCDGKCKPICVSGCLLTAEEQAQVRRVAATAE